MSDALVTPWDDRAVARPAAAATSFARLAAPVGAPSGGGATSLLCPWSSTAVPVPVAHSVTCLPTLGPTLPVQRSAAAPEVTAAV